MASDTWQRHVLLVEYDGSAFFGSQYQEQDRIIRPTVQYALEEALRALNLKTSAVSFASRTDTGVHALGQVAHLDMAPNTLVSVDDLVPALNARLPATVSVRRTILNVPKAFHSRRDASRKWYRYTIFNQPCRSPLMPINTLWVSDPLNHVAMNEAAHYLIGSHNFKSFQSSNTPVVDYVCQVEYAGVHRDSDWLYFDIVATRFLYKMVRSLMGLLLTVGRPKDALSPSRVPAVIALQDRTEANPYNPVAKPNGLTLMAIGYPAPYLFFQDDPWVRTLNQLITHPFSTLESQHHENLLCQTS